MKSFSIGVIRDTEKGKDVVLAPQESKMNIMRKIVSDSETKKYSK